MCIYLHFNLKICKSDFESFSNVSLFSCLLVLVRLVHVLETMVVLTVNLFLCFVISVVTAETIKSQSKIKQVNNLISLIEAQSMGRIVNRPHYGVGSGSDDQSLLTKSSDSVIFEGMLKDSHLPNETHYTRTPDIYEQHKEPHGTLLTSNQQSDLSGGSLTTSDNVILTIRRNHITTSAVLNTNQNVHIHHHYHHVTLSDNKKAPFSENTQTGESSEQKLFQPVLSSLPIISSPDHFTLNTANSLQTGEKSLNITRLDENPQNQEFSDDYSLPIDIRKSDEVDEAKPPLQEESKNSLQDQVKNGTETLQGNEIILKISTLNPFEDEHSEYGVPLN